MRCEALYLRDIVEAADATARYSPIPGLPRNAPASTGLSPLWMDRHIHIDHHGGILIHTCGHKCE